MTSLGDQVKSLSSIFKTNLGTFLSRVQQQAAAENGSTDIEGLLTDLDRIISNQKELSELIQKGKSLRSGQFPNFFFQSNYIKKLTRNWSQQMKISKPRKIQF